MYIIDILRNGILSYVVCDSGILDENGSSRLEMIRAKNIEVKENIQLGTNVVLVGGALTKVAEYLESNYLDVLIMNGGFVGANIVPVDEVLSKFKDKEVVRTYNFNLDVEATDKVLRSYNVGRFILVGKNVCHSEKNTVSGVWSDEEKFLAQFDIAPKKRLHDLLAAHDGLSRAGLIEDEPHCLFECVYPFNEGLIGNMTKWGSSKTKTEYRQVEAAISWFE